MMLLSSSESPLHSRNSVLYRQDNGCLDENVNESEYCKPSTSYKIVPYSPMSTRVNPEFLFSSPTKFQRGATREAIGFIWSRDDFDIVEHLGEGFFGNVFKVRAVSGTKDLPEILVMKVAKVLNEDCERSRISAKKSVTKEASVLLQLKHENILGFCGLCVERSNCYWSLHLLVDFCDRGSLQSLILSTNRDFPWLERCMIAMNVASAMRYVNSCGFMHRDLTSMNILLQTVPTSPFVKAVVADFGLSAKIPLAKEHAQQVGTQNFMSPEMLLEKPYDEKSDVFSFGIIICQMIARIDADHDAGLYRTKTFGINFLKFIEKCPLDTPLGFLSLAFLCCKYQSSARPSFQKIYESLRQLVEEDLHKWDELAEKESFRSGEVRFGRSNSDAAIRAEKSSNTAVQRSSKILTPTTIPEGVVLDDVDDNSLTNQLREGIRKVAQNFADDEPEDYSKNPFRSDARIRSSCRKIKPTESFNRRRFNRESKVPSKRTFVWPFLEKTEKVLKRRKGFLSRSQSLPSIGLFEDDERKCQLPMDSHSDTLKKISLTFRLGMKMPSLSIDDELPEDCIRIASRRRTEMDGNNSVSGTYSAGSEASTAPVQRIESFDEAGELFVDTCVHASNDSSCLSSTEYKTHPEAIDTIVYQAPPIPSKRKICSFASYPEELSKRTTNLKKDGSCKIL